MKLRRIFHPTDFSPCAAVALRFALETALHCNAELRVGHVIFGGREYWDEDGLENLDDSDLERRLREYVFSEMVRMGWEHVQAVPVSYEVIRHATADSGIVRFARARHVDLIVLGTHGRRGVRRFLLGSVASRVLHDAHTNVVVVPFGYRERDGGRILVPVDFADRSVPLLRAADAVARRLEVPVDLLHVLDISPRMAFMGEGEIKTYASSLTTVAEERLNGLAENVTAKTKAMVHVESGSPAATILRYTEEHDVRLVMMASSGMSPDERILRYPKQKAQYEELRWAVGPVTERVATYSEVPVFVVKRFVEPLRRTVAGVDENQYTMAEIAKKI